MSRQNQQRHYVFGFGSLICAESRAVTTSALGDQNGEPAIPVRLKNWVRLWNVGGPNTNTYLGVRFQPGQSCLGVLVPLPSSNGGDEHEGDDDDAVLEALDIRERGYDRHPLDLSLIERVDELLLTSIEDDNDSSGHETHGGGSNGGITNSQEWRKRAIEEQYYKDTFLQRTLVDDNPNPSNICVWIYLPKTVCTRMATPETTILQSYVDICLRGCLSISDAFARDFVKGTYGWYPGHTYGDPPRKEATREDVDNTPGEESCWINDRERPLYVRADKDFSLRCADILDNVFDPLLLRYRK